MSGNPAKANAKTNKDFDSMDDKVSFAKVDRVMDILIMRILFSKCISVIYRSQMT